MPSYILANKCLVFESGRNELRQHLHVGRVLLTQRPQTIYG